MKVINVRDAGPSARWMDAHFGSWDRQVPLLLPKSAAQNETLDSDIEERCLDGHFCVHCIGLMQLHTVLHRLLGEFHIQAPFFNITI